MSKTIKYYRIEFTNKSPLAIGSGENDLTDKDIMLDSRGIPYIPGTAMAGAYRSMLDAEKASDYFGGMMNKGYDKLWESRIITYDAVIKSDDVNKAYISKRDMVALDEYKTAKPGAKFDFQILEPGATFVTWIEETLEDEHDGVIDGIISSWINNGLRLGAKTARGYGYTKTKEANIKYAKFDISDKDEKAKWLDFDIYDDKDENKNWKPWTDNSESADNSKHFVTKAEVFRKPDIVNIALHLKQNGGLSIREYSTRVGEADYEPLKLHGQNKPIIPGTTWAGAFRAQLQKLGMSDNELKKYFGWENNSDKPNSAASSRDGKGCNVQDSKADNKLGMRSRISFSESVIDEGEDIEYTRNAIDRFSGGTIDGALYKEVTHYNGETDLYIAINLDSFKDSEKNKKFLYALTAAIMDLHNGYMAVGGLTAIGRGLFEVTEIKVDEQLLWDNKNGETLEYSAIAGRLLNIAKGGTADGNRAD